jgi:aspartyl-tRNA(Asn)/glutamyl-tRNA(Gln) amidotransferase subunit B
VPELPDDKRDRYMAVWGLRRREAVRLAADPEIASFFEGAAKLVEAAVVPTLANVMVNLVAGCKDLTQSQVAAVARLLEDDAITFAQAREVLEMADGTDADPEAIVDERGLRQATDVRALGAIVDEVLARCEDQVRQYHGGNRKVVGFLVGQCMRASGGSGNPKLFNQLLVQRLEE